MEQERAAVESSAVEVSPKSRRYLCVYIPDGSDLLSRIEENTPAGFNRNEFIRYLLTKALDETSIA